MSSATNQDPKELANYRFAKGAVIILGVLIVVALVALVLGFALRNPHHAPPPRPRDDAPGAAPTEISLPPGAQVVSMDVDHGRLILRVRNGSAEEIDIIDTGNGRLVSRVKVPANTSPPGP